MSKIELLQGDCLELLKDVPDGSVDLVVADPPYLIETTGGGLYNQSAKQYVKELAAMKSGFSPKILDELCRVMKKINCYIWCSQKQIPFLINYFVEKKKCNWNLLCWHKTNPVPACGNKYLTDTEYLFFAREKGVRIYGKYATKRTFYVSPSNIADKKLFGHPTIKPLGITENLIVNSTMGGHSAGLLYGQWDNRRCLCKYWTQLYWHGVGARVL